MQTEKFHIVPYTEVHRQRLLTIWENSVLATHNFLKPTDFKEIKELVNTINFNDINVFCITKDDMVSGFIGVTDKKIEMLFIDPDFLGQGLGYQLLSFAVNELKVNKVDVNEQNSRAVNFYQKFGFATFERTEKDDQGRNYPLLRMKLVGNDE